MATMPQFGLRPEFPYPLPTPPLSPLGVKSDTQSEQGVPSSVCALYRLHMVANKGNPLDGAARLVRFMAKIEK